MRKFLLGLSVFALTSALAVNPSDATAKRRKNKNKMVQIDSQNKKKGYLSKSHKTSARFHKLQETCRNNLRKMKQRRSRHLSKSLPVQTEINPLADQGTGSPTEVEPSSNTTTHSAQPISSNVSNQNVQNVNHYNDVVTDEPQNLGGESTDIPPSDMDDDQLEDRQDQQDQPLENTTQDEPAETIAEDKTLATGTEIQGAKTDADPRFWQPKYWNKKNALVAAGAVATVAAIAYFSYCSYKYPNFATYHWNNFKGFFGLENAEMQNKKLVDEKIKAVDNATLKAAWGTLNDNQKAAFGNDQNNFAGYIFHMSCLNDANPASCIDGKLSVTNNVLQSLPTFLTDSLERDGHAFMAWMGNSYNKGFGDFTKSVLEQKCPNVGTQSGATPTFDADCKKKLSSKVDFSEAGKWI